MCFRFLLSAHEPTNQPTNQPNDNLSPISNLKRPEMAHLRYPKDPLHYVTLRFTLLTRASGTHATYCNGTVCTGMYHNELIAHKIKKLTLAKASIQTMPTMSRCNTWTTLNEKENTHHVSNLATAAAASTKPITQTKPGTKIDPRQSIVSMDMLDCDGEKRVAMIIHPTGTSVALRKLFSPLRAPIKKPKSSSIITTSSSSATSSSIASAGVPISGKRSRDADAVAAPDKAPEALTSLGHKRKKREAKAIMTELISKVVKTGGVDESKVFDSCPEVVQKVRPLTLRFDIWHTVPMFHSFIATIYLTIARPNSLPNPIQSNPIQSNPIQSNHEHCTITINYSITVQGLYEKGWCITDNDHHSNGRPRKLHARLPPRQGSGTVHQYRVPQSLHLFREASHRGRHDEVLEAHAERRISSGWVQFDQEAPGCGAEDDISIASFE